MTGAIIAIFDLLVVIGAGVGMVFLGRFGQITLPRFWEEECESRPCLSN